ncbi:MAG TPA: DUF4386 domain-containing protein [Hyphomonadaceae bacterium]|nr:DUF4386 domain-containing protein [Hyphomonadaceae bacterium]
METETFNRKAAIWAGMALVTVSIGANIPYSALISLFDYDDVLRRPAGEALALFHSRGAPLVLAWWTFALSALGLAGVAALVGEALKGGKAQLSSGFTMFGVISGVLQGAALLRWTFVIPHLAESYVNAAPGSAERASLLATYDMLNGFAGAGMGEHLGQILLMVWTFGVGLALARMGGAMRWIGAFGLVTLPVWIVGQTELLALSIPGLPVIEVIPYAFMAWEVWMLVLGVALLAKALRQDAVDGSRQPLASPA